MGVSTSTVSRITGLETHYKNFNTGNAAMLPQQLAIIGQGNDDAVYSLDKYEIEGSADAVAQKYGYGSPLHLAALQLFPKAGAMATFPVYILPRRRTSPSATVWGRTSRPSTPIRVSSGRSSSTSSRTRVRRLVRVPATSASRRTRSR